MAKRSSTLKDTEPVTAMEEGRKKHKRKKSRAKLGKTVARKRRGEQP